MARHLVCILALMWTGLVNGQAFFFSDTSNYIRAADAAAYIASGHTFTTVWTDRYRAPMAKREKLLKEGRATAAEAAENKKKVSNSNDIGAGLIMSGRSPYIGALMYIGYVLGNFWPFVLLQATIAYVLIVLSLRRFGVDTARNVMIVSLSLAAVTALPTYNSLLLADGFASFGVLAYLLIAANGRIGRWTFAFLLAVIAISVSAHLTHITMMIAMVATLALARLIGWARPPARAWYVGVGAIVLGLLSIQVTAIATRVAFGKEPQLLPLLTARVYMDGPGRAFVQSGCDGNRFQVCRLPIDKPYNNAGWLFATNPHLAGYMLGNAEERRRMGEEDTAFALAVLRHDPLGQIGKSALNATRQLLWIDYDGLNQGCFDQPDCWSNIPSPVRETLRNSVSGRNAWPQSVMNVVLYVGILTSLVALAIFVPMLFRRDRERAQALRVWLLVAGGAMVMCSIFGGAVADPQYRYQGRLIWMVMLFAEIALLAHRQAAARDTTADHPLQAATSR
jgi:hypothetical protein